MLIYLYPQHLPRRNKKEMDQLSNSIYLIMVTQNICEGTSAGCTVLAVTVTCVHPSIHLFIHTRSGSRVCSSGCFSLPGVLSLQGLKTCKLFQCLTSEERPQALMRLWSHYLFREVDVCNTFHQRIVH